MKMRKKSFLGIILMVVLFLASCLVIFAEDVLSFSNEKKEEISSSENEKMVIYDKMLNSVDNFSTVQGKIKMKLNGENEEVTIQYKTDLENAYTHEIVQGNTTDIEIVADYKHEVLYNNIERGYLKSNRILQDDPIEDIPVKERTKTEEGINIWYYRDDPTGLVYAKESIFPQERIFGYLYDFELWNIVGEEIYAGQNCWVVNGHLEGEYAEKIGIKKYVFKIDKKTGCLLGYEGYDSSENLKDYIITNEIVYDAPIAVTYCDYSKYEGYTNWTEEALKEWEKVEQGN